MGVRIWNTGDGGTVDITLNVIPQYRQMDLIKFAKKRILGKPNAETDVDTFVVDPRLYQITAYVTNAQKATLQILKTESDHQCKLTDGELSNKNVRASMIDVTNKSGFSDYPWEARLEFTAEDH